MTLSSVANTDDGEDQRESVHVNRAMTDWAMTLPPDPHKTKAPLTVSELSRAIGLPTYTTYRLLQRGAIPGCFKLDPTRPKSHFYIPADAPERFRARGYRREA